MKFIITKILLFSVLVSSTQETRKVIVYQKAITEFGNPYGKKTETVIGKKGGQLKSDDGELELIFPEDALNKNTTVSIQPVVNKLKLGVGKAYKLEPAGLKFNRPVQLTLHYNNDEAEEEIQMLMGIALQNEEGKWFELENAVMDTVKRIIIGEINHFSVWSKFMSLKIFPKFTRLKVGMKLVLGVIAMKNETPPKEQNTETKAGLSMSGSKKEKESVKSGEREIEFTIGEFELKEADVQPSSSGEKDIKLTLNEDEIVIKNGENQSSSSEKNDVKLTLNEDEIVIKKGETQSSSSGEKDVKFTLMADELELMWFEDGGKTLVTEKNGKITKLTIGEFEIEEAGNETVKQPDKKSSPKDKTDISKSNETDEGGNELQKKEGGNKKTKVVVDEITASEFLSKYHAEWYVNGVKNGDETHGTISPISANRALYVAPKNLPDNNPVTVSVKLLGFNYEKKGVSISNPNLKSKILLYDNAYKVTVELEMRGAEAGTRLGKALYKDYGSFYVEVKKDKAEIKNVYNQSDNWEYKGNCTCTLMYPGTGMVHIGKPKYLRVKPPLKNNGNPTVEMEFQTVPASLSKINIVCPDGSSLQYGGSLWTPIAYPMYLKFEAKDGSQTILEQGSTRSLTWCIIKVKKMTTADTYFY